MQRFWRYQNVSNQLWTDWNWQQQNRLRNQSSILDYFPNLNTADLDAFKHYTSNFNFGITPYTLSLIKLDHQGNPLTTDPIWNQFRFFDQAEMLGCHDYNGHQENWENTLEMPTKILHHKYPDRAIIRVVNSCFGHCNYCYLTARILDRDSSNLKAGNQAAWQESLAYLRKNPQIRDVLISGGDPLILSNNQIQKILADLREIPSIEGIRLNTRVLTFNPFRIDAGLVKLFKKYRLTALEIHLAHPCEITTQVDEALNKFDRFAYRPLILWRAPLLHGINDSLAVLEELFLSLYLRRIIPYYIFHYAPYTLGRSKLGLSVREGCKLLNKLRRVIPGPAFPRYTLFHIEGKQDIPLEPEGTPTFQYTHDAHGHALVKFKNWKGKWVVYPDVGPNPIAGSWSEEGKAENES